MDEPEYNYSSKVAQQMEESVCKVCHQYETGCLPGQIIDCTLKYLETLKNKN